ncbi:Rv3235 family protein [Lysinibacter sp. HNR]|uniref:Rv3235 family protein n=1 Tax=Lysinibacter sp. HNR TaxID=3031408 RepID=UPI0024354AE4|nr:Rv3235 family protein [Lysinibacter sp. HNR]WGD38132.1 Rv3235 family protein [Lysinibacter sp. HNR]
MIPATQIVQDQRSISPAQSTNQLCSISAPTQQNPPEISSTPPPAPTSIPRSPIHKRTGSKAMIVRPVEAALPDPTPILRNLALGSVEIIAGSRDIETIARWASASVITVIRRRQILSMQKYQALGTIPSRIPLACGKIHYSSPAQGVIEAVVLIHSRARTRSVAIRLELIETRWRATVLAVL